MEATERQLALEQLKDSRNRLLGTVEGLSEAQWKYRPGGEQWSIADCLEHVTVLEHFVLNRVRQAIQEPASGEGLDLRAKDDFILKAVPSRARRVKGPEAVMPKGNWADTASLVEEFRLAREHTLEFTTATAEDLRSRCFQHPILGDLDCYQWLLILATHSERHARQMEEVKLDAGFPRGLEASA